MLSAFRRVVGSIHTLSTIQRLEDRVLLDASGWGLAPHVQNFSSSGRQQVFADMDGDADLDLIETITVDPNQFQGSAYRIARNDGSGRFTPLPSSTELRAISTPLLLDVDQDGDRDIMFLTRETPTSTLQWRFFPNAGDGTLLPSQAANLAVTPEDQFTTWDYDRDGRDDILLSSNPTSPEGTRVLRASGPNSFEQVFFSAAFRGWLTPSTPRGQVNADPGEDIILATANTAGVLSYSSGGGFAFAPIPLNLSIQQSVNFLRYNADQFIDIIVRGPGTDTNVRLNDGAGAFSAPAPLFTPQAGVSSLQATGDWTGDGLLDALFVVNVPPPSGSPLERASEYRIYRATSDMTFRSNDYVVVDFVVDPYRSSAPRPAFTVARLNADAADDLYSIKADTAIAFTSGSPALTGGTTPSFLQPLVAANAQTLAFSGLSATPQRPVTLLAFYDRNANGFADDADLPAGTTTVTSSNAAFSIIPPEGMDLGNARIITLARQLGQVSAAQSFSTTAWTRSFFPEGFRGTRNINEYVPFTNDNAFPVDYRVILRYETGDRDLTIASGTIPPFTRAAPSNQWGVTTSERNNFNLPGRVGTPYAIELQSSAPLAATLVRYDRNFAANNQSPGLGESFTSVSSTAWGLADVGRGRRTIQSDSPPIEERRTDYILLYNSSASTSFVRVDFYRDGQLVAGVNRTVDPLRRAGVNLDDVPELANITQPLSAIISSQFPIAVSHTSYRQTFSANTTSNSSFASLALATPFDNNGTASTVMTILPARNLATQPIRRGFTTSTVEIFNTSSFAQTVTITARVEDNARSGIPAQDVRTEFLTLQPYSRLRFAPNLPGNLGPNSQAMPAASVRITSTGSIAASSVQQFGGGAPASETDVTTASRVAATRWTLGDGFRHSGSLITESNETISLINTSTQATDVTLRFLSPTAGSVSTTVSLAPSGMRVVSVFDLPELRALPNLLWFGTTIEATQPIIASMSHYDGVQPGGWASLFVPTAGIIPLV